jgi:hypothetical protein
MRGAKPYVLPGARIEVGQETCRAISARASGSCACVTVAVALQYLAAVAAAATGLSSPPAEFGITGFEFPESSLITAVALLATAASHADGISLCQSQYCTLFAVLFPD